MWWKRTTGRNKGGLLSRKIRKEHQKVKEETYGWKK